MLLDFVIVCITAVLAYSIGRYDGRKLEERSWINSYNNCGVDDE